MHVLIITEHYWPEQFRISDLAESLRGRGHAVDVLTGMPSYPQGRHFDGYRPWGPFREVHEGVRIKRVPIVPRGRGRSWELALNYLSYAVTASARVALRRRRPWDVVLVFQPSPVTTAIPALLSRALAGIPVAIWVQDLWPESIVSTGAVRSPRIVSLVGRMSNAIYRSCDLVVGQSHAFVERLASAGIPRDRLAYVPNWAEDVYRPQAAGEGAPAAWHGGFAVMFAGNLGRVQALHTVLEAAGLVNDDPDVHWVFVGEGGLRGWMEGEVKRRGLARIHFLDRRPAHDMPGLFARAGAMLVSLKPDATMAMTVPAKLQSYLACGRPILASLDGEGARVVEEAGAGMASAAGDAVALAQNVRRLKAMGAGDRHRMGERGRGYYERHFHRTLCLDRFEELLSGLAKEGRR